MEHCSWVLEEAQTREYETDGQGGLFLLPGLGVHLVLHHAAQPSTVGDSCGDGCDCGDGGCDGCDGCDGGDGGNGNSGDGDGSGNANDGDGGDVSAGLWA